MLVDRLRASLGFALACKFFECLKHQMSAVNCVEIGIIRQRACQY
jgi:hypothetical protein